MAVRDLSNKGKKGKKGKKEVKMTNNERLKQTMKYFWLLDGENDPKICENKYLRYLMSRC